MKSSFMLRQWSRLLWISLALLASALPSVGCGEAAMPESALLRVSVQGVEQTVEFEVPPSEDPYNIRIDALVIDVSGVPWAQYTVVVSDSNNTFRIQAMFSVLASLIGLPVVVGSTGIGEGEATANANVVTDVTVDVHWNVSGELGAFNLFLNDVTGSYAYSVAVTGAPVWESQTPFEILVYFYDWAEDPNTDATIAASFHHSGGTVDYPLVWFQNNTIGGILLEYHHTVNAAAPSVASPLIGYLELDMEDSLGSVLPPFYKLIFVLATGTRQAALYNHLYDTITVDGFSGDDDVFDVILSNENGAVSGAQVLVYETANAVNNDYGTTDSNGIFSVDLDSPAAQIETGVVYLHGTTGVWHIVTDRYPSTP